MTETVSIVKLFPHMKTSHFTCKNGHVKANMYTKPEKNNQHPYHTSTDHFLAESQLASSHSSFLSPLVRVCYGPSLYWWCQSTEQTPSTHTNYKNHPNISILNPLWPGTLEKQIKLYVHGALCYLSLKCSSATGVKVPSVLWCCWLGGRKASKKTEWWGAGMVICLERVADLHMSQLMPLPLTVSCFRKIQIGFTFLVPVYPDSPGKRAVKWVC